MGGGAEESAAPEPNLGDSLLRNMNKKLISERKRIEADLLKRSKHYADILEERLIKNKENSMNREKKVDIYDKAFFLNEEMNNLKNQLESLDNNLSSTEE